MEKYKYIFKCEIKEQEEFSISAWIGSISKVSNSTFKSPNEVYMR